MTSPNPYAPPPVARAYAASRDYGGFRRRHYFLASLGILGIQELTGASSEDPLFFLLLFLLPSLYIHCLRLKNIGATPWFAVMSLVPVVNFAVVLVCLAMPEGYADVRELDTAGTVIAVLSLLLLFVYLTILVMLGKFGLTPNLLDM